jgi:hypothetical protein
MDEGIDSLEEGDVVRIRVFDGPYVSAQRDGTLTYKDTFGATETFLVIRKGKRSWAFMSAFDRYLSVVTKDSVMFSEMTPLRRESFELQGENLQKVTLFSKFHGFYLSSQEKGEGRTGNDRIVKPTFFSIIKVKK